MNATMVVSEAKAVPPVVSSIQDIPLKNILESKTNPRGFFDQTRLSAVRKVFYRGRAPPNNGTLNSGTARIGVRSLSAASSVCLSASATSGGNPSAASQQYASVLAEYPVRQCFTGSASSACQSPGPFVNVKVRAIMPLLATGPLGLTRNVNG
jgi:hypothetical protein